MKKIYLFLWSFLLLNFSLSAKQVPAEKALEAARNYLQQLSAGSAAGRYEGDLVLVHQETSSASSANGRQLPLAYYYVFSRGGNGGLVFVAADDKVRPILGYTSSGTYDPATMPPHFLKWLETYKSEVRYAIEQLPEGGAAVQEWEALLQGSNKAGSSQRQQVVAPLLSTIWNQSPFYNDLCPYDADAAELSVTGCVATAMAQIMKYWEYPAKGSGFHSYNHEKFGTLSANFGNTTYNWQEMPNEVNEPNTAVATLMQHLGVSVEMDFGVEASGAYVISAASPVEHCAEYAFKNYFGYQEVKGVIRENYALSDWLQLLKSELNAGQPILYAGFGGGGGHAFVCDGYDANDYFHMNWGWGGAYDGYFAISALNPDGLGTGGGTGSYNTDQQALIGIKIPSGLSTGESLELQLNADVTIDVNPLSYGQAFSIHTDILNSGNVDFLGDFGAAVFDESGTFVDWVKTYSNVELPAGYHFTDGVLFDNPGLTSLLPGTYQAYVFYRTTGGQWEQLGGGTFADHVVFAVEQNNSLELSASITIEGDRLYQGSALQVSSALKNKGESHFSGWVDLSLYNLKGDHVFTIAQQEVELCVSCSTENINFFAAALDVEPGTYLMYVQHYSEAEGWQFTGAGAYTNPLKVVVETAPISEDGYEHNDEVEVAYELPVDFSSSTSTVRISTPGANIHLDSDYDFYKIRLPEGYQYELSVQVQDYFHTEDNTSYSNDVLFSLSEDGVNWTDAYDDKMTSAVMVEGGTTVYIFVAPYFQGETGTYLLDVDVAQGKPTAVEGGALPLASFKVFPNPTAGKLQLDTDIKYDYLELSSISGKLLQRIEAGAKELDLSRYQSGIYLLRVKTKEGLQVQKIVKK